MYYNAMEGPLKSQKERSVAYSPSFVYFTDLIPELQRKVAVFLKYKDLMGLCETSKMIRKGIYEEDFFWKEKSYYDFEGVYCIQERDGWITQYRHYMKEFSLDLIAALYKQKREEVLRFMSINRQRELLIVDMKDIQGSTPLIEAAGSGYEDIVRELLALKADPNIKNRGEDEEYTALMLASGDGYLDIARQLLNERADPNIRSHLGETALTMASEFGHLELVQTLLDGDSDPNIQTNYGNTALMFASRSGYLKMAQWFVNKGAKLNLQSNLGETALMMASRNEHIEMVNYLLDQGADKDIQDVRGKTALDLASMRARSRAISDIISAH